MNLVTAPNMLAVNKDVGNGELTRLTCKLVLDGSSLGMLVQLDSGVGPAQLFEETLGFAAVRAVRLGEYLQVARQLKCHVRLAYRNLVCTNVLLDNLLDGCRHFIFL